MLTQNITSLCDTRGPSRRQVEVLVAQCGPQQSDGLGGQRLSAWLTPTSTARGESVDLIVLSELATTPFFSVSTDRRWFNAGETLDGPGLQALAELAREANAYVLAPFAERGPLGELFNSAVLFGRDGTPITGVVSSGPRRGAPETTYRKVHLSENNSSDPGVHEKYFFRPGDGFVVFDTDMGRIGILICYDRSFPEAWRAVRLAGARIILLPVASSRPERSAMFARELQIAAMHNGVFVVAASKGGVEAVDEGAPPVTYFGTSQIVNPFGDTLAIAPLAEGPVVIRGRLDLDELDAYERTYHLVRDRRPEAY